MGQILEVKLPDIGDFDQVDVVEVLVSTGDTVAADQGLITLESDKASMEIPSPAAGTVAELKVKVGDQIGQEALILTLDQADNQEDGDRAPAGPVAPEPETPSVEQAPAASPVAEPEAPAPTSLSLPAVDLVGLGADSQTEVLVLGSGPGGYTAAFRAADLGKRVTLVERFPVLGGVCLNVGCIPSKALLHAAKVIDETEAFAGHGITFGNPQVDLDKLRSWKEGVVGRLVGGLGTMAKQRKVEVITGTGTFTGPNLLTVATPDGERTVAFEQAIIAAGSRPVELPGFPYEDPRLVDSTGALELADIPKRMLILGGGIIGLEMATVYAALGSKITVVELMDGLIPGCDRDLVRPLQKIIQKRYENIYLSTKVTGIKALKKGLQVSFEGENAPEKELFDKVLVGVGRRPNGGNLGAQAAGVHVDERGFIPVDRQMRTNVPHIFAIGDIVGQPMLAHKATHEAKVAAEVAAGEKSSFDARVIPSVAYTDPEVAWVGLTETEAKAKGIAYEKGAFPWAASGRALSIGRPEGLTKLLFDPQTERLLGAGIVGPSAGDLIAEASLAIEMGADASDIGLTIHPHPTLSETVAMGAEAFEGTLTDLYLPKRKR